MSRVNLVPRLADDRVAAYLELEQDMLFAHMSPDERLTFIDRSLAIGRQQAAPYIGEDVMALAPRLGATVAVIETDNRVAGVTLRAEHDARTHLITVYRKSIAEVHRLLEQVQPGLWDEQQTLALHVSHELFHHLEATRITPVHEQLPSVVTFRVGRFAVTRARARRCREIAAHAFAKELLGLPFLPNAVDWLVLVGMGKWSELDLMAALERAETALVTKNPAPHW